jgi:RNA polymerase sigma-70 factor (ECF subfamily)
VVEAFLSASRDGDFDALLDILHPEVVLRADSVAVKATAMRAKFGAPLLEEELGGASAVPRTFAGRAAGAEPALVNGSPGAVWAPGGRPTGVFVFAIRNDKVVSIDVIADPEMIRTLDLVL